RAPFPLPLHEWKLNLRLRCTLAVVHSAPAAITAIFLIYPIGEESFPDCMPLRISSTFNFMLNEGYKLEEEEETYNMVAAHGYFGQLIFKCATI
ncbi:Photosystem II protein D1, partial [Nymphaea thermarum]